jgi:hypothetical protein
MNNKLSIKNLKSLITMKQYNDLYEKLVNNTISPNEMKLLNHLAFGTPFMNSNDKGSKQYY